MYLNEYYSANLAREVKSLTLTWDVFKWIL